MSPRDLLDPFPDDVAAQADDHEPDTTEEDLFGAWND